MLFILLLQVKIGFTLSLFLFQPSHQQAQQSKSKRSPLEIGYVQFSLPGHHGTHIHQDVTIHVPSVVAHAHNTTTTIHDKHNMLVHTNTHDPLYEHRNEWIPGHVRNHAYIPGHVHHVIVPASTLLVAHPVHAAVLLHPVSMHPVPLYRKHYGGFGVGVDYGGHGAGHGFHVV